MWIYKGKSITKRDQLPEEAVGFVYKIYNKKEDKTYIGKKILANKRTRKPLKGYKRKRVDYVESNWMKYMGSSIETKKWNLEDCVREIVYICFNKTMMTYYETSLQFKENVLENDEYINDNILGKFYKKTILKYKEDEKNKSKR